MNVLLLAILIILLVGYMLYLARRKDFQLLKTPPQTQQLPRAKVDQALKALNEFKKRPKPKSRRQLIEHNSEQFYLEKRLFQIQKEIDQEQKSYYLACKERDIAWNDYKELFDKITLIEKLVSPGKINDIKMLRNLYLDAERKVDLEISKFNARTRVRQHEEAAKLKREEEIVQKTQEESLQTPESDDSDQDIQQSETPASLNEIKSGHNDSNPQSVPAGSSESFSVSNRENLDQQSDTSSSFPREKQFGQDEFSSQYPDFYNLTYIDESLSVVKAGFSVVQDANFDSAFFVSVQFVERHQYKDCSFKNTDFSYSNWQRCDQPHRMLSCSFFNTRFNSATFDFMAFYNCHFQEADFRNVQLRKVKFVNCVFVDCNIAEVDFSSTVMSNDMLNEIDFSLCTHPPKNAKNEDSDTLQNDDSSLKEFNDINDSQ